jgi:hypothetical protein
VWGGQQVSRAHAGATPVVQNIQTGMLDLLLEPGTITRERQGNEPSTLDIALSTPNLTPWIVRCKVIDDFHGSDHLPIETTIQINQRNVSETQPARRSFKRASVEVIADSAKRLRLLEQELATPQEIEGYVNYLVGFVQDLIRETVLYSKLYANA